MNREDAIRDRKPTTPLSMSTPKPVDEVAKKAMEEFLKTNEITVIGIGVSGLKETTLRQRSAIRK